MNHAETATPVFVRAIPRLMAGLTIMAAGLLWTLDNLDVLESEPFTRWWPVAVIVIGLVRFLDPAANRASSTIITLIGVALLLDTLDYWDFDPGDLFPLIFAMIGAKLIYDVFRRRSARVTTPGGEPDAVVHAFAIMSGVGRRSIARDFRGGDANAIMGGVELDLTAAQIAEGQEAVLEVFALWGGVEIRVPKDWRIVSHVFPLMGAYEDNTTRDGVLVEWGAPSGVQANAPVLIIRGVVVMGAIEVKNMNDASARK
jgi:predicted membrane protein